MVNIRFIIISYILVNKHTLQQSSGKTLLRIPKLKHYILIMQIINKEKTHDFKILN
nr:MAG TPA: hypothetical protein [Caudoviricetes sp.]